MTERIFTPVARCDEIADGDVKLVELRGRSVLLIRNEGRFFAIENRCSHADEPLLCGRVKRGWIACPAHGARFDLDSGEPLSSPATDPITVFATRVVDAMLEIEL